MSHLAAACPLEVVWADTMTDRDNDAAVTHGLMDRVRAGDREALNRLLTEHEPHLRRIVDMRLGRQLRRRTSVSDVVQAAQIDVVQQIGRYFDGEPIPFQLWLRRIAQGRVRAIWREHMQAAKRDVRREVPLPDHSSVQLVKRLAARGSSPSQHVSKQEMATRVRQALAELAETDCEVLLMRDFEGLPYEEIAYVLGTTAATARKRRGRALIRLGTILRDGGLTETNS